jgi:branched-chain amino acid aminotransferase
MNTRAELYGAGIFTTIRIIDGRPWLWEQHSRRLQNNAAAVGMDLSSVTADDMLSRIETRIAGQDLTSGRLRLTISDKRTSTLWPGTARNAASSVTVQTAPLNEISRPFRLGTSNHLLNSTSPLAGLKTGNYLEPLLSVERARKDGFTEAVRLNERGLITSACMANIFWLRNGELYTPPLSTGCLPGTTREFVIENLPVREAEAGLDTLRVSDAVFLTSAGLGVIAVDEFDGRAMTAVGHPILSLIPDSK